jgi:hypothetical protein
MIMEDVPYLPHKGMPAADAVLIGTEPAAEVHMHVYAAMYARIAGEQGSLMASASEIAREALGYADAAARNYHPMPDETS